MTTSALTLQKKQNSTAFFTIKTKSVLFEDVAKPELKKVFRGKKIIVNTQTGDELRIVSEKHQQVSHRDAYRLGRGIFRQLFKCTPDIYKKELNTSTTDYCVDLVNEQCKILMTSSGIEYQTPSEDRLQVEYITQQINLHDDPYLYLFIVNKNFRDEYYPFVRVTNYLRSHQLFVIEVGYYRWKCSNGLMFGRKTESTFEHSYICPGFSYITLMAENHFHRYDRHFLANAIELWSLLKTSLRKTDMKLLVMQLFEEDLYRLKLAERVSVMNELNILVEKYVLEIRENANATINVATDLLKLVPCNRASRAISRPLWANG